MSEPPATTSKPIFSDVGEKLSAHSGICELMDDLGSALSDGAEFIMMGGGNPGHIPQAETIWRERMGEILEHPGQLEAMLGDYDRPRGKGSFLATVAAFFRDRYGWPIDADNVAVTNGSQTGFFLLFNLLAGRRGPCLRKILFPLVPEYIGYVDQAIEPGVFTACRARIEHPAPHRIKYAIDFDALEVGDDVAAMCVSRPTNPSTNVLTDEEIARLAALAERSGTYLLIDNAYGEPFPGVIFRRSRPIWNERIVMSYSLSKLGLPAVRTGILVGPKEIIARISRMNAVVSLANSGIGQVITAPLFASGRLVEISAQRIRPFYRSRSEQVLAWLDEAFEGVEEYHVHLCEGAFFLWVWFRDLPISDRQLYARLKARGLLVVPGSYFYPGLSEPWDHRHQCIRLSYGQDMDSIRRGVTLLADEVRKVYAGR